MALIALLSCSFDVADAARASLCGLGPPARFNVQPTESCVEYRPVDDGAIQVLPDGVDPDTCPSRLECVIACPGDVVWVASPIGVRSEYDWIEPDRQCAE